MKLTFILFLKCTENSNNASEEPDEPAKEHDLDKLELQLGRIPISRHGVFQRMPKLLVFAKAPRFSELMAKRMLDYIR